MKKQSIFPSLPKNLTVPQLRKEIRRRLKISEQLGCWRRLNFDHLCRLNLDQGLELV